MCGPLHRPGSPTCSLGARSAGKAHPRAAALELAPPDRSPPGHLPNPRYEDPEFRLRFARLVTHYWRHAAFLGEDQLLRDAATLNGIPGVLIHGRYDVSPLDTAWQLSQRWSTSELHVLDDAGHGGGDSFITAVVGALNRFAAT